MTEAQQNTMGLQQWQLKELIVALESVAEWFDDFKPGATTCGLPISRALRLATLALAAGWDEITETRRISDQAITELNDVLSAKEAEYSEAIAKLTEELERAR